MTKKWTPEEQALHRRMWVKALRSGEYEQTMGCLRDNVGFCCLGVACDVYLKSGDASKTTKWETNKFFRYKRGDEGLIATVLPAPVKDWLGLQDDSGTHFRPVEESHWNCEKIDGKFYTSDSLSGLNDSGKTFKQIADIIEDEPKKLIRNVD
jgi:hypothetical protein